MCGKGYLVKKYYYIQRNGLAAVIADLTPPGEFHPSWWYINRIHVMNKYQGNGDRYGTQVLSQIVSDADQEQAILALEINSYGPLDHDNLEQWYRRYGFEYDPDLLTVMVRYPQKGIDK